MDARGVRRDLLKWYDAQRRDLPWRPRPGERTDAYAVFVSEVMLQQTRTETVKHRFGAWMRRFPDWATLAAAEGEEVMAQWAGLGYYRRARHLHAAARHVAREGLPEDPDALRRLPGVGPYMAAAVASIAWGRPVAAVDGNVVRVLSRWLDVAERVDRAAGRRAIEEAAAELVDPVRPGDWNQALMDLGATVCTPRPHCARCPVAPRCRAHAAGTAEARPVAASKARPRVEQVRFALVRRDRHVLVVRRPEGLLAGTWMLPGGPRGVPLAHLVTQQTGLRAVPSGPAGTARHVFTHRIWDIEVVPMGADGEPAHGRWVDPASPDVALSAACLRAIGAADAAAPAAQPHPTGSRTVRAARPSPFV